MQPHPPVQGRGGVVFSQKNAPLGFHWSEVKGCLSDAHPLLPRAELLLEPQWSNPSEGGAVEDFSLPAIHFVPTNPASAFQSFPVVSVLDSQICPWQTRCFFFLLCPVWFKKNLSSEIILCHKPFRGLEEHPSGGAGRPCVLWSGC